MAANRLPQIVERTHGERIADPPRADPPHHRQWSARVITAKKRFIKNLVNPLCLGAKCAIGGRLAGSGKIADCRLAAVGIGEQIEVAAVVPRVPRDHVRATDRGIIVKVRTALIEDFIEHVAHGEDGRPTSHAYTIHFDLTRLAADVRLLFEHGHTMPARSQQGRTRQAANSRSDDGNVTAHRLPRMDYSGQSY